jgi:hypothetical protein
MDGEFPVLRDRNFSFPGGSAEGGALVRVFHCRRIDT